MIQLAWERLNELLYKGYWIISYLFLNLNLCLYILEYSHVNFTALEEKRNLKLVNHYLHTDSWYKRHLLAFNKLISWFASNTIWIIFKMQNMYMFYFFSSQNLSDRKIREVKDNVFLIMLKMGNEALSGLEIWEILGRRILDLIVVDNSSGQNYS